MSGTATRKRSEPWLHRWSRPAIVALTLFGFSLTTYLTVTHFFGQKVALCDVQGSGCDLVLSSEYAKIFGIPLTIFGALGYLTLGLLAGLPLILKKDDPKAQAQLKELANFLMFMVSAATVVCSCCNQDGLPLRTRLRTESWARRAGVRTPPALLPLRPPDRHLPSCLRRRRRHNPRSREQRAGIRACGLGRNGLV